MIFQLPDCTFEISAKPILTNFLSFLAQSPGGMIKGTKNIQKNCKISWKCRKQLQKLLYMFFAKRVVKKFSNSEIEEKRKKIPKKFFLIKESLWTRRMQLKQHCHGFPNKGPISFTRSPELLGKKNIIIPKNVRSITSAEDVECCFYNPAKNFSSAVGKELLKMRKQYKKKPNEFY